MKKLLIGFLLLAAACTTRSSELPSSRSGPAPSGARPALDAFLGAIRAKDLQALGANWGDKDGAIRDARILVANKQPVGVPSFPIFNKQQFDQANGWVKPYVNVPTAQMRPFLSGIFKQRLYSEPAVATQAVYHALDPVVQAVFTNKDANIPALLAAANSVAQKAIDDAN